MAGRIVAVGAAAMLAGGAALAQGGAGFGPFDGLWAIDVVTDAGPCGRGFAGDYVIADSRISGRFSGAGGTREVTGTVGADGTLMMRIGGAEGIVLRGLLRWRLGWGDWESAACSGRFMTNRK